MFFFYNYKVKNKYPLNRRNHQGYLMMFALLICYAVFDFTGGDFDGYYHLYQSSKIYSATFHMEPVYGWLIDHTTSYYQWRLIVWGASLILWLQAVKD